MKLYQVHTITKKQLKIIIVFISLTCFLIYSNSLKNEFALDDNYVTSTSDKTPHSRVQQGIKGIPEIFSTHYIESRQQNFEYRPVVLTTFAIEYDFFGINPHISHFINLLFYTLSCIMLFIVLIKLLTHYNIIFPILITFLFIAHPIHTEVVNNLKSRDELLSFLFGISALYFFIKNVENIKPINIIFGIFFLSLALLSKKTAVLFFILIPLTLYFFASIKPKKLILFSLTPIISFLIFKILKFFLLEESIQLRAYAFFENPLFYINNFWERIPVALYTAGYYLKLFIYPHPLSSYYGYNIIPMANWSNIIVWVSMLFHISLTIIALIKLPQKKIISYGILIYLIGIFPFTNLFTPVVGIIGERFVYFASLGFCISISYLILTLFKIEYYNKEIHFKYLNSYFKTSCIILLSLYSIKSFSRNPAWKNELTLFRHDVKNFEKSCNLNYILANALSKEIALTQNETTKNLLIKEAKVHFKKTAELMSKGLKEYPNDFTTQNNLATIYVDIFNDTKSAQPIFKKVIELNPKNVEGQYNYGYCYEKRNLPDSAIYWYENMLSKKIKYLPAYQRLYELHFQKQAYKKAIESSKKAIEIYPEKVALYINVGNAYMYEKDTLSGLDYFEKAAAIPPLDYVLLQNVSNVFKVVGNEQKAKEYAEKSRIVMPKNSTIH